MATQPISESGAIYSRGGHVGVPASRTITIAAVFGVSGLLAEGAARPLSATGLALDAGGFGQVGNNRPMTAALSAYVTGGVVSLLNLRLLSQAFSGYVPSSLVRSNQSRALSPGYLAFIPPPPASAVDASPPVVGSFNPAPGTPIARSGPISFEVTDDSGDFRRIFVVAFFPATGVTEVVHDGDGFRGHYAAGSSRTLIAGGFRYTVLRTGGWPGAPTIQTFAIDRAGNEAS